MKRHLYIDKTLLKFIIVGIINTIVGTSIMFIFYNLIGFNYWISTASNYIVGSIVSYILNKYFTFRDNKKSFKQIIKFVINISLCYFIAYGLAKPIVAQCLTNYSNTIKDNVSMLIGMAFFVVLNYSGQKFIVFKKDEK